MTVPVADQRRLIHILADDLQPRIDWAYALEQTIALLGGGYLTAGNGDPNGLVTKPEGYLFLDLTTPAVWQNQNGGTVWTNISAGGGSGLPDPWTANQTSGEVVARTDGTDATPFTIEAVAGQTENGFVVKDESGNVVVYISPAGDVLAQGVNMGLGNPSGGNVFATFDKANTADQRRGGIALYAESDDGLDRVQLFADAGLDPDDPVVRHRIVEVKGDSANDGHVGFFRFRHTDDLSEISIHANVGQTAPLLDLQDENDNSIARVLPSGAIGTSAGEPADGDINPGECFRYFDPTNGAARMCLKGKTLDGTVVFGFAPMAP